ncbi:helix-turn-helix domain-containing protein [Streptomyces sp. NPDC088124]|uniref:helix-turn-helix domain-containing protein n=1 Tax=Streptomyces sp. NPDC088124 TaxID=3154654 RepID=UPI00343C9AB1
MLSLGSLPTQHSELELKFVTQGPAVTQQLKLTELITLAAGTLLEKGGPSRLSAGALILVTGTVPGRLHGHMTTAIESLLRQMSRQGGAGLVVSTATRSPQSVPQSILELANRLNVPFLLTTAPAERWKGLHESIQKHRLLFAERRAAELGSLVQQLPAQLADPRTMQRIADWLARALDAQVLVSEPERVLAASPATAAEELAQAIIRQTVDGSAPEPFAGPHTQLISLAPASATDTVLAVARQTPFDEADLRLLRYGAKLLGLVDQAYREYHAASDASHAARSAAFELLMDAEIDKARRVMRKLAPGLLDPDTARVFALETNRASRDTAVLRCHTALGQRALVVPDPKEHGRLLIVQSVRSAEEADDMVSAELTRLVGVLGAGSSLGGSGVYSMSLLADALQEAITAQRFATLQAGSVALSVHEADLISLLPQEEAQQWARHLLRPLMQDESWEPLRETLPSALAYQYTVAARRLGLHRNTIMRRVARAAELLRMNFAAVNDRVAVALALELVTQREAPVPTPAAGTELPSLRMLLSAPQVHAWAQSLLKPVQTDRRDLLATARTWLSLDAHVEPTARMLGLAEGTVRSHLRALETYMQRDFTSLGGIRDLHFALHIVASSPGNSAVPQSRKPAEAT